MKSQSTERHCNYPDVFPRGNYSCLTRVATSSRGQQINAKYKQISKVVHMFLPEIQTKIISLSASAQISTLLRTESEWAQERCTRSAPMALQLSDKLVFSSHMLPSTRERALNMIGGNTLLNPGMHHMPRTAACTNLSTVQICLLSLYF